MGKEVGIGEARLSVFARTTRCEATNVDPARGVRDMAVPAHLQRTWGHQDFGIYAKVVTGGEISIGAPVTVSGYPDLERLLDGISRGEGSPAQGAYRLALPSDTIVKTSTLRSASRSPTTGRKSL